MCGLTGFLDASRSTSEGDLLAAATRMSDAIAHRGPDDSGAWADATAGIAFGFRRLAIVDLSVEGRQPMISPSGRYVLVFNGEIYNYRAIRQAIEETGAAPRWRGHSDTEVLLAAFEHWGIAETIRRCVGMFAIAVWDREKRQLSLGRDRLGEKPLYYGWQGTTFLFGSELKTLRAHPAFAAEMNRDALIPYLRYKYIPTPFTIYQGIAKLPPATILTLESGEPRCEPTIVPYWSAREAVEAGVADPFTGTEAEAADELDRLLREAVGLQMVADVPLGAFLSGGIDSSTIVSLMQAQSERPVRTFTIGFHEMGYDEAQHAKAVARHIGTDHTELYLTPEDALAVIPRLPTIYDEPFADVSGIPTFLVSQMARRDVTVSLSGDGGDELFGGYTRYAQGERVWRWLTRVPRGARAIAGRGMTAIPTERWEQAIALAKPVLPDYLRRVTGNKIHKLATALATDRPEVMYLQFVNNWANASSVVLGATEPLTLLSDRRHWLPCIEARQRMMYLDLLTYLPDAILTKVDRASMAVSLESRAPFLDHRVVEFAWRLPPTMTARNGQGKWLLRQVLDRYVPRSLIDRPKMGFGMPVGAWLHGPLREWAAALLSPERLREEGIFESALIQKKWSEHLSGNRDWGYLLWDVLMFQGWLEALEQTSVPEPRTQLASAAKGTKA